jgi:hypothetical protein
MVVLSGANGLALCEGGILKNLSLHFSTSVDYCFTVENSTSAPLLQSAC